MRPVRAFLVPMGVLVLHGCSFLNGSLDREILDAALRANATAEAPPRAEPAPTPRVTPADVARSGPARTAEALPLALPVPDVRPVAFQADRDDPPPDRPGDKADAPRRRLNVPNELPGADAPAIETPKTRAELDRLFPAIPPFPADVPLARGPDGRPLSLGDLQHLGELHSPAIKNAMAAVEMARGAAKQAGAYPNPNFILEQDTVQTGQAGYQGGGFEQVIKTGGKLKFQQAAAVMDLLNAQLALRRARSDNRYAIRGAYFSALVARENARVSDALFRFTDQVYRAQVDKMYRGFAASYEPVQLRPLVLQARLAILQARNQAHASWKQLAAAAGLPHMPESELAGRVDMPVPAFDYKTVEAGLVHHTDFLTALNNLQQARYNLEYQRRLVLPDVDLRVLVQKDLSAPPFNVAHTASVTLPVPLWDQNRGGIYQAQAHLAQTSVGPDQARDANITTLADAWNRLLTAEATVETATQQIRDQIRVYRRVYAAHDVNPGDVGFGDIVTAQQTLGTYVTNYVTALGLQWQAVVDVANLLQTEDLYALQPRHEVMPIPDLQRLLPTDRPLAWDGIAPRATGGVDHGQAVGQAPGQAVGPAHVGQAPPAPAAAPAAPAAPPDDELTPALPLPRRADKQGAPQRPAGAGSP